MKNYFKHNQPGKLTTMERFELKPMAQELLDKIGGLLMIEVNLNNGSLIWLCNETPIDAKEAYSAVYLIKKREGKDYIELSSATLHERAEKLFWGYYDECKGRGYDPVVSYCSYD
jgi:hypothetical protein